MPIPLIRRPQVQEKQQGSILNAAPQQEQRKQAQQMDKMMLDRLLRKPRSKEYMEAMHKLDAGGHVQNKAQVDAIIDAKKAEFPEVTIEGIMLGCVSICYLGRPYEVHPLLKPSTDQGGLGWPWTTRAPGLVVCPLPPRLRLPAPCPGRRGLGSCLEKAVWSSL